MSSEARNEFEARYNDRVRKIRKAAAIALKELDHLRSGGPIARETFDTEVGRIHKRSSSLTDAISLFFDRMMASRDS